MEIPSIICFFPDEFGHIPEYLYYFLDIQKIIKTIYRLAMNTCLLTLAHLLISRVSFTS